MKQILIAFFQNAGAIAYYDKHTYGGTTNSSDFFNQSATPNSSHELASLVYDLFYQHLSKGTTSQTKPGRDTKQYPTRCHLWLNPTVGCIIWISATYCLGDIALAPRQRLDNEWWNEVEGLAWKLSNWKHLVCVACLTPCTLVEGTTSANWDVHPGDLRLHDATYFKLQTL